MASLRISIFFLGVSSLWIASTRACYTVYLIEVKDAVVYPIRDSFTLMQISSAISEATFLSVRFSLNS